MGIDPSFICISTILWLSMVKSPYVHAKITMLDCLITPQTLEKTDVPYATINSPEVADFPLGEMKKNIGKTRKIQKNQVVSSGIFWVLGFEFRVTGFVG